MGMSKAEIKSTNMETPIEIFNNTHIELTRIVKFEGEYYMNKYYLFLADIKNVEAARYGMEKSKCSKVWFNDGTYIKVSERYKAIRDTHITWWKHLQDVESKEPPATE